MSREKFFIVCQVLFPEKETVELLDYSIYHGMSAIPEVEITEQYCKNEYYDSERILGAGKS